MAKERCPKCIRSIPTDATTCPKCGKALPEGWVEDAQKLNRRFGFGCLGVLAIIVTASFLYSRFGGDRDAEGRRCGDAIGAYHMSTKFIERRLKSPSSASFSGYGEARVSRLACRKWQVAAYVDAQNSFGAKLRTYYEVILLYDGDETWRLAAIRFRK